jgi:acyl-coenzyme A thioesterase PaaI-like protein
MARLRLDDDGYCFACGKNNPQGLKLEFSLDKENCLGTQFRFTKEHQGYKDIAHGGIIALILDEVMGNLCWRLGKNTIGAQLEVRFKHPTPVGSMLYFKGWIEKEEKNIVYMKAEARNKEKVVVAFARGKGVRLKY